MSSMEEDLMALEDPSLTAICSPCGSPSEKGVKKGKQYGPCMVCGLVKADMPNNSRFCWDHKRSFEAMVKQTKDQDKKNNTGTEGMDKLNKMKDEAGDPPSDFSTAVVEFESQSPATGRGSKRNVVEMMGLINKYSAKTQMRRESKKVMMHKARWMKLASDTLMYPVHYAESMWTQVKNETPTKETDNNGPEGDLRLPMPVEESVIAANIAEHERAMTLEGKRRKITSEQQIEEGRAGLIEGHASFNDSMFHRAGGGAFSHGGGFVTAHGAGSFCAMGDGSAASSGSSGVIVINSPAEKKSAKPSEKVWDIEVNRLKLKEFIKDRRKDVTTKIDNAFQASDKAFNSAGQRIFGEKAVDNQRNFVDVMLNRMDILRYVFVASSNSDIIGVKYFDEPTTTSAKAILQSLKALSSSLEGAPKAAGSEMKIVLPTDVLNKVKTAQMALEGKEPNWATSLFKPFDWDQEEEKFGDGSGLTEMQFHRMKLDIDSVVLHFETTLKALEDPRCMKLHEAIGVVDECIKKKTVKPEQLQTLVGIFGSAELNLVMNQPHIKIALQSMGWQLTFKTDGHVDIVPPAGPLFESNTEPLINLLKVAFGSTLARLRLLNLIALKKAQNKAMPIASVEDTPVLYIFDQFAIMAQYAGTEDQDKTLKKSVVDATAVLNKLIRVCQGGISECLNNVSGFDKKKEQEQEKIRKQADAEALKKTKEDAKKAAATAKKKAEERGAIKQAEVVLLNQVHDVITDIEKFDDEAAASAAQTTGAFDSDAGIPYIIVKHKGMIAISQERAVKAAVGVFKIQYPSSTQATKDGRGQTPYNADQKDAVRKALIEVGPPKQIQYKVTSDDPAVLAAKAVESVSLFACSSGSSYAGLEKHGIATLRHSIVGQREFAVLSWTDMLAYATKVGMEMKNTTMDDYAKGIVDSLKDKPSLDVYKDAGGKIYRGIAGPESTTFVPMGCIIVERVLGDSNVIGFRAGSLYSSTVPVQSFKSYTDCFQSIHGKDNSVTKYWAMIRGLMETQS